MKMNMMKVVAIAVSLVCAETALADDVRAVHIGISPFLQAEQLTEVRRCVGQVILEMPGGTSVVVSDGYAVQEIASFNIPQLKFDSPAARARKLVDPFGQLGRWYDDVKMRAGDPVLAKSGALRIPEYLDSLHGRVDGRYAVVLIGDPQTISVEEPTFSMRGGRIPTDGHLVTNLSASIYGTAEKAGRLKNASVHLWLPENALASQAIKQANMRFWSLFVELQGGRLVGFNSDLRSTLQRCLRTDLDPVGEYTLDREDTALEMRIIGERNIGVKDMVHPSTTPAVLKTRIVNEVVITNEVVREIVRVREVTNVVECVITNVPTAIPVPRRGRTGIAIWWQADADVDLYVSCGGSRELSYQCTNAVDGVYYRDIRHANADSNEESWKQRWEYVELSEHVNMGAVTVWLNLFKVNQVLSMPVTGKVRIQFGDGRIWEGKFRFSAGRGNGGLDRANRATSPYWIPIDFVR